MSRMARPRLHYAWIVTFVTFTVLLITAGIRATPGLLMVPLETEFGWSRAAISGAVAININFNLGYVFHEIVMGGFFKSQIGDLQRDQYIIPLIAIAFICYTAFQAYLLPVYFYYTSRQYGWGLLRTAIVFGAIVGFTWDGLQGGIIEVATFKMPMIVFWYDSAYHTLEGILMSLILAGFYKRFFIDSKLTQ